MAALRMYLALAVLALCADFGRGAPPEVAFADLWQTIQAHKHLQEDDELAALNLGLKVRGRVATLWGPVPSIELSVRAERRLRTMIQLIDVRNELIVMPDDLREWIVPAAPRPLFLPEKNPPPLREASRPLVRPVDRDHVVAWDAASAKP